jgi:hypothetical protein
MPLPCRGTQCVTAAQVGELSRGVDEEFTMALHSLPQSHEVNRVSIGYFLGELCDKLRDAATALEQGIDQRKFELFSGHDGTLQGIKSMLNAYDMLWPPYVSAASMSGCITLMICPLLFANFTGIQSHT